MSLVALVFGLSAAGMGSGYILQQRGWIDRLCTGRALRGIPVLTDATGDGEVARAAGTVRAEGELLTAPLSGRACVAYRTIVRARNLMDAIEVAEVIAFTLDTTAGPLRVDGTHAVLGSRRIRFARVDPARAERVMLANGWRPAKRPSPRYVEHVIELGARVEVAGLVMREANDAPPASELGFRDEAAPRVRLAGDAAHPLIIR